MSDDLCMFIDMPADEYHSDPAVVGHSALVSLLHSPKHYHAAMMRGRKATDAMEFGTAFHTQVLEPERFAAEYVVKPKFDLRTNVGKEGSAAWDAENPGKTIISEADRVAIEGMFDALTERTDIARTIQNSYREKSYFWTDEDTGIACRLRADLLVRDEWTGEIIAIADLKSTQDASKARFSKEIANRGYDLQAAFYADAVSSALGRSIPFFLIPVESAYPHGVASYKVGPTTMEVGRKKYRAALQLLQWCRENDRWPSYQLDESEVIEVPSFYSRGVLDDQM